MCSDRIQDRDADVAAQHLDQAFARLLPRLVNGQEDVRLAVVAVAKNVIHACLQGRSLQQTDRDALATLEKGLGTTHQPAWPAILSGLHFHQCSLKHGL